MIKVGIIGGSGLDDLNILKDPKEINAVTPYGKPSSTLKIGKIQNTEAVFLARHGRKHEIPPTQVNYRANIYALQKLGCTHILATTACGSLRKKINRGHLIILDQFIDFTRHRKITFHEKFENGPVHAPMATPFNEQLRNLLIKTCKELNLTHHEKGTVITIEGPRFSTKAESNMFRQWGADVINMSIAPEAILSNEAGIPYAAIAMSTDYDCWKSDEEPVTWEAVLEVFNKNADNVKKVLLKTIPKIKMDIKDKIRTIPNFPKQGVMFRDITTLLKDPEGFQEVINQFVNRYKDKKIDAVVGIESRGFILGGAIAHQLGVGFIPVRKPGKLPADTTKIEYELEYGKDALEIHNDAIQPGQNILIIDDLIATGGTAKATADLVTKLGGNIVELAFIVDLPNLKGKEKISNYPVFTLVEFEGE